MSRIEQTARHRVICGVDEAGRGPLAGPIYAAAVILDEARPIAGLRDSKKLSPARREALAAQIRERAASWAIASATVAEIDQLNILRATLLAMERAVAGLAIQPALARIDGNRAPRLDCAIELLIGGDDIEPAISAASILAKTERDTVMLALEQTHPGYGFAQHKGYGTAAHLAAIRELGPCAAHRRSFAPIAQHALDLGMPASPTTRATGSRRR